MNKQNAQSSINDVVKQCHWELQELATQLTSQTKRSVVLRNQLTKLQDQLQNKHNEALYTFQVDLQRLSQEFQRKCLTQKHYSANLQANLGKMEHQQGQTRQVLRRIEERVQHLTRMVG